MKEHEVSQDDANIFEGKTRSIQYAVSENGDYVQVKSVGFEAENIVMDQAWEEVEENIQYAIEEIKAGRKSPIFYFMKKEIMDEKILSEYTGIPKWRIRRHLKPKFFLKIKSQYLEKYVIVFRLKNSNEITKFIIE